MTTKAGSAAATRHVALHKKTSQDTINPKTSSMNKGKRATFEKYRGQGKP
jgi:hypothetical protein